MKLNRPLMNCLKSVMVWCAMRIRLKHLLLGGLLLGMCPQWLVADTNLVSGIFGYYKLPLLGNSDTIVSLPFAPLPATSLLVASVAGNVVQLQTTTNLTVNQFVYAAGVQPNTYYARIDTGTLEGRQYAITGNGTTSLTLNLNGATLTGLANGDTVSVVAYWTLGTVFTNGNGIHLTTDQGDLQTEVLIPDVSGTGKNLSTVADYYYYSNSVNGSVAWRLVNSSATNLNDAIIQPNTYLIIRHNIPTNTTFISMGDVILTKVTLPLRVNAGSQQDNVVGLARPLQVSLNDAGLITSGAFVPTTNLSSHKDDLIVFDNTTTNQNKSAASTYYYYNLGWRKIGASTATDYGSSNVLLPGAGFIIRKAVATNAPIWVNTPTYTNQ